MSANRDEPRASDTRRDTLSKTSSRLVRTRIAHTGVRRVYDRSHYSVPARRPYPPRSSHQRHADDFVDGFHLRDVLHVLWHHSRSLFSAGCGLAKNFGQMLVLRMGVGVGEASLSPSAYSLLTDYFPSQWRATAMSIYTMGIFIGIGVASVLGGFLTGWATGRPG